MKKLINLFLIIALPFSCYAQLPTSGLIAWYPFCGNTADYSGNGYNLHDSGAVLTTDRFGNANCAYHFSGGHNEMTRTPPLPTDGGNFTYAAWLQLDTSGNMVIFANGNLNLDGYEILVTGATLLSPGNDLGVIFGNVNQYFPTPITLHEWHQAILRRTATSHYDFIIDTVLVGSFTSTFNLTHTYEDFTLGMDYTNGTNSLHGKLDDIAVYNRALSDAEIRQLYHYNPDVNPVSLGNDTAICGGSLTLTAPAEPLGTTYLWNTGSTDTSVIVSTTDTYWLTVSNSNGCKAGDTLSLNAGSVFVDLGPDTAVCLGSSILLMPATTAPGYIYSWSTGATTPTIYVADTGIYWLTVSNGICSGSDTIAVNWPTLLQPHDTGVNVSENATFFVVSSLPSPAYQWQKYSGGSFVDLTNTPPFSGVTTDTLTLTNVPISLTGSKYRCVISKNDCSQTSDSARLTVHKNSGTIAPVTSDGISVYPDPATNMTTVYINGSYNSCDIQLINELGQIQSEQKINGAVSNIDLSKMTTGIYLIKIHIDNQVFYKKLLKN